MELELNKVVKGTFNPKDISTLRSDYKPFIGHTETFRVLWKIEDDDFPRYTGQYALGIHHNGKYTDFPMGWIPQEDIDFVED